MMPGRRILLSLTAVVLVATACPKGTAPSSPAARSSATSPPASPGKHSASASASATGSPEAKGIEKLDHLIFIVMENRSFDHYFGTYPGANGIPKNVCVPDPAFGGRCARPYHDTDTKDVGGPHTKPASDTVVNHGKMDGFIQAAMDQTDNVCANNRHFASCKDRLGPQQQPEVMGYHTRAEIPVYWEYADNFVLQDRMFAPTDSWTLPAHLYLVSAWSAVCANHRKPMSCRSEIGGYGGEVETPKSPKDTPYAWTDITWLMKKHGVSWSYFVAPGGTCYGTACDKAKNSDLTTGFQNVLPGFLTIKETNQERFIRPYTEYVKEAESGDLPQVSWVMPSIGQSEHPGHSDLRAGQRFVTQMVNAAMQGPDWDSTAIFITWDDWGGFYDHVKPPKVDVNGYGIRVPGLMISPYAKEGYIDHQTLTFDAYLKLIEDRFMDGQRLDPKNDGRPDPRPTVRENVKILGDLAKEFDFTQPPRPPLILKAP
ncbi:MAG: alkaline phosphatase family protein [Actinomycetota bacterium]